MKNPHFIAMDTHGQTTSGCVKKAVINEARRWDGPTRIPALVEFIESVPRPRYLTFEEGPLADWLLRNLRPHVDELLVCHARRNAHIAKEGDKDDAIDAEKLCDLFIGGYLKAVHHPLTQEREVFKQLVALYNERVRQRVREANKIIGQFKRWGLIIKESQIASRLGRPALLENLPRIELVRSNLELLCGSYDALDEQVQTLSRRVIQHARQDDFIVRLTALPGIRWIRGSIFSAYIDTPWRFHSKSHLWSYMGIGLKRRGSGDGIEYLRVNRECNYHLKGMILGAANSIILKQEDDTPFAWQYRRWIDHGLSPRNARRNLARSVAATAWAMWKNGSVYEPRFVGLSPQDISRS